MPGIHIAHTDQVDTQLALAALVSDLQSSLGAQKPKAGLIYSSVEYDVGAIAAGLQTAWADLPVIGCTTDGEMSSVAGFTEDGVVVVLFEGEGVTAKVASAPASDEPAEVARALRAEIGDVPPDLIVIAPPSMGINLTRLVEAMAALFPGVPIVGGSAADHAEFAVMSQVCGGEATRTDVPALALWGPFTARAGVRSGWVPMGRALEVTASEGHILLELDHRPALGVYEEHWGVAITRPGMLADFPIHISDPGTGQAYLRAVFGSDPERGALVLAGDAPVGSMAHVAEALPEGVLHGSTLAAEDASHAGKRPFGALIFSCAARKWVLGGSAHLEIDRIRAALGPEVPVAGFYAFGEIGPSQGISTFFNESCVCVTLWETHG